MSAKSEGEERTGFPTISCTTHEFCRATCPLVSVFPNKIIYSNRHSLELNGQCAAAELELWASTSWSSWTLATGSMGRSRVPENSDYLRTELIQLYIREVTFGRDRRFVLYYCCICGLNWNREVMEECHWMLQNVLFVLQESFILCMMFAISLFIVWCTVDHRMDRCAG